MDYRAGTKHQSAEALFHLRMTEGDWTFLNVNLLAVELDGQKGGAQNICIMTIHENEEVPFRATEEQTLHALLTEKELVLEQKLHIYFQTPALHPRQPDSEFSIKY